MMRSQVCTRILLVSFVVWFIVLLFVARHLSSIKSGGDDKTEKINHRLEAALGKMQILQENMKNMKSVFENVHGNKEGTINDIIKEFNRIINGLEDSSFDIGANDGQSPRPEYEKIRKKIENDVRELWFYFSSQLTKLKEEANRYSSDLSTKLQKFLRIATEHKLSLVKDVSLLAKVDGFSAWRETEAANLASELEQRLKHLQNPEDCDTAKKLICNLNKGCGFGCQIHHAAYCLIVAYATRRTLILSSNGWRYHKNGWQDVFLPVSDTCVSPVGISRSPWPGKPDTQVVVLPIIDSLIPRPDYLPPAIPKDLAPRLINLHDHPLAWWIGQMVRYLMRPQPVTAQFFNTSKHKMKFRKPIVGVHIRRTDKIGTEAAFHPIEEYMKHVEEWYDQQEQNGVIINRRSIYLATDDPKVIVEAKKKYPEYDVLGDVAVASTAGVATRYSNNSLYGIMLDIHLLSLSDHLVCTFSSQVCRVAYEIMQTYNVNAASHFTSLDDVYYYGGQNGHSSIAILPHVADGPEELSLEVGDRISVAGNHWNGYSKGKNLRTNKVGLYPSFKVQNRVKVVDFPK